MIIHQKISLFIICLIYSLCLTVSLDATQFELISNMGASAKSIALGNIEGFSNTSTAVFTNPASLYNTTKYSLSVFSATTLLNEINYHNISFSGKTSIGIFGIGLYGAAIKNNPIVKQKEDADKTHYYESVFDYEDTILKISYQRNISNQTSIGTSYSHFLKKYYKTRATGNNIDLGLIHKFTAYDMSVFIQNMIPQRKIIYKTENISTYETLPCSISTTIKYTYKELTIYPQLSYIHSNILYSLGFQYNPSFMPFIDILMGYKQQLDYIKNRHPKITFGLTLTLMGLQFQYAYERSDYFLSDHNNYLSFNYNL